MTTSVTLNRPARFALAAKLLLLEKQRGKPFRSFSEFMTRIALGPKAHLLHFARMDENELVDESQYRARQGGALGALRALYSEPDVEAMAEYYAAMGEF